MLAKVVVLAVLVVCGLNALRSEQEYVEVFNNWQKQYGRTYTENADRDTYQQKLQIFKDNLNEIETHNAKQGVTYELGLNEYADMSWEEFKDNFKLNAPQHCSATNTIKYRANKQVPKSVDWRTKNVVTPVKNQGHCGSCWTFSSTGALESHNAIKNKKLLPLSEQQLVDCAGAFDNHGCNGGLPSQAFEYIHYAGGIQGEDTYAYEGVDRPCRFNKQHVLVQTKQSVNITEGDEPGIVNAVADVGPVSIAYQVVSDFRFYKKGVYSSAVCKNGPMDVNHAVLVVGYNTTEANEDYYIIKNSWGTSFGIDGYFWMIRDKNMCGIAVCSSYPDVVQH